MQQQSEFKTLVQPLVRRWYIIAICVLVSTVVATRYLILSTPLYQAVATLKIDDAKTGVTTTNLFRDFDVFKLGNNVETEVEVLKSRFLFEKALSKLDFNVEYYSIGDLKTTEVHRQAPITVEYKIKDTLFYSGEYDFTYLGNNRMRVTEKINGINYPRETTFGSQVSSAHVSFTVYRNDEYIKTHPHSLDENQYRFHIYSNTALAEKLMGKNFMVKAVDKEINIIKIYFKHPVPDKAMKMVNALAEVYIEQGIDDKVDIASHTVDFIDQQIAKVSAELSAAREAIEKYKQDHNIVNLQQETESSLRTLSQFRINKLEVDMQLSTLENMREYLRHSKEIPITSPEYGTVVDPLFTEGISKLNQKYRERRDLMMNYTDEDPRVKTVDNDIEQLKKYVFESIANTREKLMIRQDEIGNAIRIEKAGLREVPMMESTLQELMRSFILNEKVYNFLVEKRTEAIIARSVNLSFNRILEKAPLPRIAVFPVEGVVYGVAVFIGLLIGIISVYLRRMLNRKVQSREDLDKQAQVPFIANIEKIHRRAESPGESFTPLCTRLMLLTSHKQGIIVTVTSTIPKEGKTFVASHLAKSFANMDKKVLVIDMDVHSPGMEKQFDIKASMGMADVYASGTNLHEVINITSIPNLDVITSGKLKAGINTLVTSTKTPSIFEEMRKHYDVIIIDTPHAGKYIDAVPLIKWSDVGLYIVRANYTRPDLVANAELLRNEYDLGNLYFVLNGTVEKRNYTGYVVMKNTHESKPAMAAQFFSFKKSNGV